MGIPSQTPSFLVVEAKQAGLEAPASGEVSIGSGARTPSAPQFSEDAPETARATASGGGPGGREGAEDKRAPLADLEPRLVPLSSSSCKQQLQTHGVERKRQKTRFQMRDAPPAPGTRGPSRVPPPPPGRARPQPDAQRGGARGRAFGRPSARGLAAP